MRTPAPAGRRSLSPRPGTWRDVRAVPWSVLRTTRRAGRRTRRWSNRAIPRRRSRAPIHRGCRDPGRAAHRGLATVDAARGGHRAPDAVAHARAAAADVGVGPREAADPNGQVVLHDLTHLRLRQGLVGAQRVLDAGGRVLGADGDDPEGRARVGVLADLAQSPGE